MNKEPKILLVKAQQTGMKRNKDGTVTWTYRSLDELPNEDFALADQYHQQVGWKLFKTNEIDEQDIPETDAVVEGGKTLSQRLRASLYVKYLKTQDQKESFQSYYARVMEGFIGKVQDSIPD